MKNLRLFLALLIVIGIVVSCSKSVDESNNPAKENTGILKDDPVSGPHQVTLWGGQSTEVGYVEFVEKASDFSGTEAVEVQVSYVLNEGYYLTEIHFDIETTKNALPHNKGGNLIPGHFKYKYHASLYETTYSFTVPYDDVVACDNLLYYAAHATIQNENGNSIGAWSDGEKYSKKGNWATYNTITLECTVVPAVTQIERTGFAGENQFYDSDIPFGRYFAAGTSQQNIYYNETEGGPVVEIEGAIVTTTDNGSSYTIEITLPDNYLLNNLPGVIVRTYVNPPEGFNGGYGNHVKEYNGNVLTYDIPKQWTQNGETYTANFIAIQLNLYELVYE